MAFCRRANSVSVWKFLAGRSEDWNLEDWLWGNVATGRRHANPAVTWQTALTQMLIQEEMRFSLNLLNTVQKLSSYLSLNTNLTRLLGRIVNIVSRIIGFFFGKNYTNQ